MLTLLAFIGLAAVLWWLSKTLTRLGLWLEALSEHLTDRTVLNIRTNHNSEQARAKIRKAREALNTMKGEEPEDGEYTARVREEIDRLT